MKPALVLVDLQGDYLMSAGLQPTADDLVSRASLLLNGCRQSGMLVIHVLTTVDRGDDRRLPHWRKANRWQCVSGTTGHEPPEPLRPLAGEMVVHKTGFNPFASGKLEAALRRAGCDTVLLAGLHLHACIRTAAVECLERNFQVRIAEDAVAGNDPILAAGTRRWLAQRCVEFESVAALLTRIEGGVNSEIIHRSPRCSNEVLFQFPNASADEIATATQAARTAWPAWRHAESSGRLRVIEELAVRLEANASDLARQMAVEIGKPMRHGLEEVRRTAANLRDVIRCASTQFAEKRVSAGRVRCEPLGVIAVISAWNNPVAIPLGKIAPALAHGNTVVWKPAPAATRLAEALLKLIHAAGLPPDAVRLVSGDHRVAQELAASDEVNAVTLTGSSAGGFALAEICARRVIPFQAELSGNNAAIVWDDADLDFAAAQVAWGAFAFAGQRCTANRRVIVPIGLLENILPRLQSAAARLPWGDPLDETTEIGPVIQVAKRDELVSLVARAQADGSAQQVILPHETRSAEAWVQRGAYAQPVIVCCEQPEHALVQEETMSPLLVVQPARDFGHALALCNGVRHGLAAALFSPSLEHQRHFLDEVQAGILKLNSTTAGVDVTLPFGGWKASGVGPPEHGEADRFFYTRLQAVYDDGQTPSSEA
jgi:acyl-CoA reductase-like NAD-dependent aldehyde dehydrogenase